MLSLKLSFIAGNPVFKFGGRFDFEFTIGSSARGEVSWTVLCLVRSIQSEIPDQYEIERHYVR